MKIIKGRDGAENLKIRRVNILQVGGSPKEMGEISEPDWEGFPFPEFEYPDGRKGKVKSSAATPY